MSAPYRLLCLAIVGLLSSALCLAQGTWERITPPLYGGSTNELLRDHDGHLWAAAGLYVWRSTNEGRTWEERSPLADADIISASGYGIAAITGPGGINLIALYPANGRSNIIHVTVTGGLTWQQVPMPEAFAGAELYVLGLRSGPGLGFVRTDQGAAAFTSIDGGTTWTLEQIFVDAPEWAIEAQDGSVYCVDEGANVIRKRSPDAVWSAIVPPTPFVFDVNIAGTRLLCSSSDGQFVSTNDGQSWQKVEMPDLGSFSVSDRSTVGYADGSFTIVTTFNAEPYGNSLSRTLRLPPADTTCVLVADSLPYDLESPIPLAPNSFIAIDWDGCVASSDGGATFERRTTGMEANFIWRFAISGTTVVAATISGELYRTRINGNEWDRVTPIPRFLGDFPIANVVSPAPRTFVASSRVGVLRSTDDGDTWTVLPQSNAPDQNFITVRLNGDLLMPDGSTIQQSTDLGTTWTTLYDGGEEGPVVRHLAERANGELLFCSRNHLYRIDGSTATIIDSVEKRTSYVVTSPADANVFGYISGDDEPGPRTISVTRDGGATWSRGVYTSLGGTDAIVLDAVMNDDGVVFTSNFDGLASMHSTSTEVTLTSYGGYRFPVGLRADGSGLLRSTASYIERNDAPVSVAMDHNEASFGVAPNPVRDVFTIIGANTSASEAQVVDMLGVVRATASLTNGTATMSVSGLTPGCYLVRTGSAVRTIIVQR